MIEIICIISNITMWIVLYLLYKKRKDTSTEFYTDYTKGNLILRIYKPEFEFQAIGNIDRAKLLDRGNFSQFYVWCLIEN